MYEFKLPDLGEGIHEAETLKWFVAVGDLIDEDADLVEVETDKAAVTIPSPRAGTVVKLAGEVGGILTVGQVVAVIDTGASAPASPPSPETPASAEEAPAGVDEATVREGEEKEKRPVLRTGVVSAEAEVVHLHRI